MIKKLNKRKLFVALSILSLAMLIQPSSGYGCCDTTTDYSSVTIMVYEDGHGEVISGQGRTFCEGVTCLGPGRGTQLSPLEVLEEETKGAHLTYHSEEARRNYQDNKWDWYARTLPFASEDERRIWVQEREDIDRRRREARGEDGRGGATGEQQSQTPPELQPIDAPPEKFDTTTIELGPTGGGREGGGVRGSGGTK